jgi:hypothetical protein
VREIKVTRIICIGKALGNLIKERTKRISILGRNEGELKLFGIIYFYFGFVN